MKNLQIKIIILLIIPVLLFNLSTSSLFGVAHAVEESGHSAAHKVSILDVESNDHCPACPNENPHNTDHSHASCEHHSSQYTINQIPFILYNPTVSMNLTPEPLNAFPEVYLDKFIPPEKHV